MPQGIFNRLFLFWRAIWHMITYRFRKIIILTLYDAVLPFDLCYIEVRNLEPIMLKDILF